jgi:Uma2 family endonuclease
VIVEVLSASTESYDRGEKFMHYRRLESLREYVLVAQDVSSATIPMRSLAVADQPHMVPGLDLYRLTA